MTNAERNHAYYLAHKELCAERSRKQYEKRKDDPTFKETNRANAIAWKKAHPRPKKTDDPNYTPKTPKSTKERHRKYHGCYLDPQFSWEDVEGYDGWTTNTVVHHRWEGLGYSVAELKAMGKYYGCRAAELLCMTPSEHRKLHHQIKRDIAR